MKKSLKIFLCMIVGLIGLCAVYGMVGRPVIEAVYEGRSIPFLNAVIQGQKLHSLSHYTGLADRGMIKLTAGLGVILFLFFITYFIPWTPNMIALLIGVIFSLVLILGAELIAKVFGKDDVLYDRTFADHYLSRDETGLRIPNPGKYKSVSVSRRTKQILYEITYTIDSFRRRETAVKNKDGRDQFILFLGCSFTYGEGVQDDQTLPVHVGALTEKFMPYNYGFHGRGPHDVLAILDKIDFKREVLQKNGILIYTFIPDHINRTVGSMSIVEWNYDHVYYAKNKNGDYERRGTFATVLPFQTGLYRFLKKSSLLRMLGISLPRISHGDIAVTADLIEAAKSKFLKQYPQGKFIVNIYPPLNKEKSLCQRLIGELKERNISYLYYDGLFDGEGGKYTLSKEDPHPSLFAYKTLAGAIVKDLKLAGNTELGISAFYHDSAASF